MGEVKVIWREFGVIEVLWFFFFVWLCFISINIFIIWVNVVVFFICFVIGFVDVYFYGILCLILWCLVWIVCFGFIGWFWDLYGLGESVFWEWFLFVGWRSEWCLGWCIGIVCFVSIFGYWCGDGLRGRWWWCYDGNGKVGDYVSSLVDRVEGCGYVMSGSDLGLENGVWLEDNYWVWCKVSCSRLLVLCRWWLRLRKVRFWRRWVLMGCVGI